MPFPSGFFQVLDDFQRYPLTLSLMVSSALVLVVFPRGVVLLRLRDPLHKRCVFCLHVGARSVYGGV